MGRSERIMELEKFNKQIFIILNRYKIPDKDKEDLFQDIQLILLSYDKKITKETVYKISTDIILKYKNTEDNQNKEYISDVKKGSISFPDLDTKLDAEKAVQMLTRLPQPYGIILEASFGVGRFKNSSEISDVDISKKFNKSTDWVYRQKKKGLQLLKNLMNGE